MIEPQAELLLSNAEIGLCEILFRVRKGRDGQDKHAKQRGLRGKCILWTVAVTAGFAIRSVYPLFNDSKYGALKQIEWNPIKKMIHLRMPTPTLH